MTDYAFLALGLGTLVWVAVGALSLNLGLLMDDEPLTPRDVIFAFTLEPLFIIVGLIVSTLFIVWVRIRRELHTGNADDSSPSSPNPTAIWRASKPL